MPSRPCLDCGDITTGSRCHGCRLARGRQRERTRQRPSARQRGYTTEYERNRATLLAASTTCGICGHPGADQADHRTPTSHGGAPALANLRPAHGTKPCETCGRRCNQERGAPPIPSDSHTRSREAGHPG
ncbi:5-methylcytosine-specific restriction enzyme A [Micromonospora inyonensis]|uniref:5-methylcytosine-specific restriction enzyme A n=1 Tax=Micromonospora inyonensis TaxID=47866 RepID=A0A1C6RXA4_9ACTN|nr:5-methylcytosine-specific restriction enzyme A [Micromonospora inyonensis]